MTFEATTFQRLTVAGTNSHVPGDTGGLQQLTTRTAIWAGRARPVIVLHGAGGEWDLLTGSGPDSGNIRQLCETLAGRGYICHSSAHGGAHTWGNDTAVGLVDALVDWALTDSRLAAGTSKVAVVCLSMGHVTAVNYALRHPDRVAAVFGAIPATNLVYHYHGGVEGNGLDGFFPDEINTAYGLPTSPNAATLDATVKAERDPTTRAADIAALDIPWRLHVHSDDAVTGYTNATDFAAAADVDEVTTGTGGHYDLTDLPITQIAAWLDTITDWG